MKVISKPSPNFNQRADDQAPSYIILHYTGMKTAEAALERLCDPAAEVSAHYTIDEDGTLYQHVEPQERAWHAGKSYWRGITDMNSAAIGIELVNPGHEHGYRPFDQRQMTILKGLLTGLIQDYGIAPQNILGHSDIAPERRWYDPGELFPWAHFASEGIGVWPQPIEEDYEAVKNWTLDDYTSAARQYGYDPECGYEFVLRAFERHFMPELILGTSQDEKQARARLACLLRLYGDKTG